jgi:RIO-like serine/threonine protein kinase
MGLPLDWIGRLLARHEIRLFRTVQSIEGVPRLVGTWGVTGLVHEYVEGRPLAKGDSVDDRFFPRLADMLRQMHAAGVAYVDLEKRENILLRDDGGPALIDFQISWHLPANRGGKTSVNRLILHVLQQSDQYHLLKHWRRLKPEQLASEELARSFKAPFWIRWHRAVFRPFTQLRRRVLVLLGARESASGRSPG